MSVVLKLARGVTTQWDITNVCYFAFPAFDQKCWKTFLSVLHLDMAGQDWNQQSCWSDSWALAKSRALETLTSGSLLLKLLQVELAHKVTVCCWFFIFRASQIVSVPVWCLYQLHWHFLLVTVTDNPSSRARPSVDVYKLTVVCRPSKSHSAVGRLAVWRFQSSDKGFQLIRLELTVPRGPSGLWCLVLESWWEAVVRAVLLELWSSESVSLPLVCLWEVHIEYLRVSFWHCGKIFNSLH